MFQKMTSKLLAVVVATGMATTATIANAGDIAITFKQHDLTLVGAYLGFENNAYIIQTNNGPLHVPADMVLCTGIDCYDKATIVTVSG